MTLATLTALTAASTALALSDGTPVDFVKITSKNNIQVRVPTAHDELGADPLRIFKRDGSHYKDETDLKLVIKEAAAAAAPVTPAPAPTTPVASNDATYLVNGEQFDNIDDAKAEAITLFSEGNGDAVQIFAIQTKLVGTIGFTLAA